MAPAPLADSARKPGLISVRSVVFVIAAAAAAAHFILDSYWSEPAPPRKVTFRTINSGQIAAAHSFQNLTDTICWMFSVGFTIRGCVRLNKAMKYHYGTPEYARLWKRTRLYFVLGIFFMTFPFIRDAMQGHMMCNTNSPHPCPADIARQQDSLQLLAVAFWHIGGLGFYFGSLALAKAQQLKDDPAAAALKNEAAGCLLIGFMTPAAAIAWAGFQGVELWFP
ncbi:MAG: hypothetical protein EPN97_02360 [Alphaproteobacteria bacterium]|nr:MAG: hypothetical protein EPN97_02360 [Alphaproteobacteria bacterium]